MVLCHFLETNQDKFSLRDKNVIELGAGTGLVTIVSSLLGTDSLQSLSPNSPEPPELFIFKVVMLFCVSRR